MCLEIAGTQLHALLAVVYAGRSVAELALEREVQRWVLTGCD